MKKVRLGCLCAGAIGAVANVVLPALVIAQLVPVGSEFQVNTYTADYQSNYYGPRVGAAADGRFVVTWQNPTSYSVSARRFDSSGAPVGADFQVRPDFNYLPSVAVPPGGGFTVAWEAQDGGFYGIFKQRFTSTGSPMGTEVQVNTYITADQGIHAAAADGAGEILIAWESSQQDGNRRGIYAQRFDSAGFAAGTEFQVNGYTVGSQAGAVVAGDPAGGFVVAFSDYRYDGILPNIRARRYDSSGSLQGSEFQVNAYTNCFQGAYDLSIGPGGDLVAVIDCHDRDGDHSGLFGRRFSSSGAEVGTEFQINTHTQSDQSRPSLAHDAGDGFTVTWQSDHGANDFDVFGQRFTSAAVPSGPEFQINTFTYQLQAYSQIVSLPDGQFVVLWTSEQQSGQSGVYGQRLAPVGTPLPGKKLLIKNPPAGAAKNKLVVVSKDPALSTPQDSQGDPRCAPLGSGSPAAGGTLVVSGADGDVKIDLPCAGWVANASRTKFTYRDATGATCKKVLVRAGRVLKAVCAGPQITYALGLAQGDVGARLTLGNPGSPLKFCMSFGAATGADVPKDGSNGRVYRARNANPPAFCP